MGKISQGEHTPRFPPRGQDLKNIHINNYCWEFWKSENLSEHKTSSQINF